MEAKVQIWNQDCIAGMAERISSSSVHLAVTSIPFEELSKWPLPNEVEAANQFTYSGKLSDVGNNGSTVDIRSGRFALNMRFVVEQAYRVLAPGCNFCCHIQQLLAYKVQHGFIGRRDFRGAMIDVFSAAGFQFKAEFVIPKNPQAMAQRLNLHSLMFVTGKRNSNDLGPAINDYVLIFQKPGEVEHPVRALFDKKINPGGWLSSEEWIRDASGVWSDIEEIDILDGHRAAREHEEEKHVCPLQLEVIRRLVRLYSNPISVQPDVTVLDPFSGIASTGYMCVGGETMRGEIVGEPRNYIGFELKESYFNQGNRNIAKARRIKERRERERNPLLGHENDEIDADEIAADDAAELEPESVV